MKCCTISYRWSIIIISLLVYIQFVFATSVNAPGINGVDSVRLTGKVFDKTTSREIVGTRLDVLRSDSSLVNSVVCGRRFEKYLRTKDAVNVKNDSTSQYFVNLPAVESDYILKFSKDGYETRCLQYTLKLNSRESEKEFQPVFLSRVKVKTLDEFTVKASKVKFYNKGDTIVYNADAFALPEGSMLDALIAQMPGVEIRDNKIYVNGRFVESLLLNGKDFFKGNKKVMMDNIGAYAVNRIKVYEKKDDMSYILGDREDVNKEFVMDVHLKKDYMTGYMINAEAGGGTSSRYIGRLFAMQYTNNSRLALYGNANNINKSNNLSESKREISIGKKEGINRRINGGLDYLVDNALHTWEISGNVDAAYNDKKNNVVTNAVNYLQNSDTYEFSEIDARSRDFLLSTLHNFKLKKENWNLSVNPKFSYNKTRHNDETASAVFNEDMQNLNKEIIKAVYSGNNVTLRKALINRNLMSLESEGHGYEANLSADSKVKIPGSPDAIAVKFQANYSRKSLFGNSLQDLCYGGVPESSALIKRLSATRPQYNFNIQGLLRYFFRFPLGNMNASYEFAHTQNRKNSDVATLEAIADNCLAEFDPDELPVADFANSYTSKLYRNEHRVKFNWAYKKKMRNGHLSISFQPAFIIEDQHLFYNRGGVSSNPERSTLRFNIPTSNISWQPKGNRWEYRLEYKLMQKSPNLVNMVDIRNSLDPLNIIEGNPELKNSTNHRLSFTISHMPSKRLNHSLELFADWTMNDFLRGYRYDSDTGVKTIKTYNVSGNYDIGLYHNIYFSFGSGNRFYLSNDLNGDIYNYSNMIGYDASPAKQTVCSKELYDNLNVGYVEDNKYSITLTGSFLFARSTTERSELNLNNHGYWDGGIYGWVNLPFNFSFDTDFKILRRFGYIENSANSTDFLWNAKLEYSIRKGEWRIGIKASDILNQMKGVAFSVNANGRKQTLGTVLPRYIMLTVNYRFDFKPKRK